MTTGFQKYDNTNAELDLDSEFIQDSWLVDQYIGQRYFGAGFNYVQFGNGSTSGSFSSPIQIGSLTDWQQISLTFASSFGIKTDGTLWVWGVNTSGQLTIGGTLGVGWPDNTLSYSSAIQLGSLNNWKQISAQTREVMALKTDGTLWGWGRNGAGVLGTGDTTSYSSPIQIGSLNNWKYVNMGFGAALAIKTDGTLWGWGSGVDGALGMGTNSYFSPVQVGSANNWKQVTMGGGLTIAYEGNSTPGGQGNFSLLIKTDGSLWFTGSGGSGRSGLSTTNSYFSPVQIGSLTNWRQAACGYNTCYAIRQDNTLWAWGDNSSGQLGNGTTINYSSPIQVGSLSNWKSVYCSSGAQNVYGIKTDGTLWGWGNNFYGQLGNNTTVNYSSPTQIGSLNTWKYANASVNGMGMAALTYEEI